MLRRKIFSFLVLMALGLCPILVVGCNTVEGAGEDIEAGGDAIEDAAEDAND
jgi:predicted small secreted protein